MATPETSISIESFSQSWLVNQNPLSPEDSLRFSLDHTSSRYFDLDLGLLLGRPPEAVVHGGGQGGAAGGVEWSAAAGGGSRGRVSVVRRCWRLSKRVVRRYVEFLVGSACSKLHAKRSSSKVGALDGCNGCGWRRSCDSESSIYEAVLHCKRSIGK